MRTFVRRLPPLAWRDRRIAELRQSERRLAAEVRELTKRLAAIEGTTVGARPDVKYSPQHPSWHWRVQEQARIGRYTSQLDPRTQHPRRRLLQKLHNYELARSHGLATPRVFGIWQRIEDVTWEDLPPSFVLKSNRGYSGRGVLPLTRAGEDFHVIGTDRTMSVAQIVDHYRGTRHVAAPYFAEEILPGTEVVLPDDVKIYAFYGEVADVLLRRVPEHGNIASFSYRFVDAEGRDLGQVQEDHHHDPDIGLPTDLPLMVRAAEVLSRAVPVPFVRVDLYQVPGGIMLGELTPLPGSSESFTKEHDRYLGALYAQAEGRVNLDLATGRPYAVTFGPHPRDVHRPMPVTSGPIGTSSPQST